MFEKLFETFSRSWEIVKKSFSILMSEKKLLLFPIISGIAMIALILSFIFPVFFIEERISSSDDFSLLYFGLFYLLSYFVIIFFNSALIHAASNKIEGKKVSIIESISFSLSKIVNILLWSIIAATVGVILNVLRNLAERQRGIGAIVGSIVISLIGMAWTFATFFVIPVLIFEGSDPFSAIKRSIELVRKNWGETVTGGFGISMIFLVLYLLGVGLGFLLFYLGVDFINVLILAVVYFIFIFLVQITLDGIFLAALYKFATSGKTVVFSQEEIQGALKSTQKPK